MPIYHYPEYITKEEFATKCNMQVRTINSWIKQKKTSLNFIKVDGYVCVRDSFNRNPPSATPLPGDLEWVRNFAKRNKLFYERVYEEIIRGTISGYVIGERIFINKAEPELIAYLASYKRKKKKPVNGFLANLQARRGTN